MDQKTLREMEKQCIQEEAAECVAACPIHLNARTFIGHLQSGDWDAAWKVLRQTMPFPALLGRICDAPCRERCKRREAGDPIEIGALERACVSRPAPRQVLPPVTRKEKRIAVFGSGLSSLTVCWDLARKGYPVSLFESDSALGAALRQSGPGVRHLSPDLIEAETAVLSRMGVQATCNAPPLTPELLAQARTDFDAVYIGLDAVSADRCGLPTDESGGVAISPRRQSTGVPGVFAGGCSLQSAVSPVWQAAEGRWAATSIDRWLQKVSADAGREKDGPYATRLFTATEGIPGLPAVAMTDPDAGYSEAEALEEAARCLQCECLECVKVCTYLEAFGGYPRRYAREIYNNASIVMGARQANKLINSCSLCGLCETVCPEDFAMQALCLSARREMVARNKMPPSAHEFALLDMAYSRSEAFALARHQPGFDAGAYLFFPGCQICASSPDAVFRTYQYLCDHLSGGVSLMLGCCGAPAHWSGRAEAFQAELADWRGQWQDLGKGEVILACSTCHRLFSDHLADVPVTSLWQLLEKTGLPPSVQAPGPEPLAVHDPCTTRAEPAIQDAARRLLNASGVELEELPLSRERTECCGFGGLMQNANPAVAKESVRRRAALSDTDYVTYCGMCRDNLAGTGKRVVHLLEILFPGADGGDPAARKSPGWTGRRENRARLRERFLHSLWGEAPRDPRPHEAIRIQVAPAVREILEQRRILDSDIQKVLLHAQESGESFFHPESGRYRAFLKPFHVTFWVEYTPAADGKAFTIHNAYSHRMEAMRP